MLKIPLQIYLDPEVIDIYKQYSKLSQKSVSSLIRHAVEKEVSELQKKLDKKQQYIAQEGKDAIQFLRDHAEKYKHLKYHHPDKTDDELLYGE